MRQIFAQSTTNAEALSVYYRQVAIGCHGNLPVLNLLSASVTKFSIFAPAGKTMRWIEK